MATSTMFGMFLRSCYFILAGFFNFHLQLP